MNYLHFNIWASPPPLISDEDFAFFWGHIDIFYQMLNYNKYCLQLKQNYVIKPSILYSDDNQAETLKFSQCNFTSDRIDCLNVHVKYVHDTTFYTCDQCGRKTKTEEGLEYHIEMRHPENVKDDCPKTAKHQTTEKPRRTNHIDDINTKLFLSNTKIGRNFLSPELVILSSLKNSPISSNHQNFHQNWWQKKHKTEWNYCHQNWWNFRHLKTHQFLQITKIFTKIGDKKSTKLGAIIVTRIGEIFVT